MIADCTVNAPGPPQAHRRTTAGSIPARSFIYVDSALDDSGLSVAAFRLVGHLSRRLGKKGIYPSADNMAEVCRMEKKTVFRGLKELEDRGIITRTARPGRPTVYALQPMESWRAKRVDPESTPGSQTGREVVGQTGRESTQKAPHEGNPIKVIQEDNPNIGELALHLEIEPTRKKNPSSRLPTSPAQQRLSKIMGRRLTTEWSMKEVASFKALGNIDPSDLEAVETFYLENQSNEKAYLRTSLATLLNNFPGEVDKARAWSNATHADRPSTERLKF
jgi:hypothetical protein